MTARLTPERQLSIISKAWGRQDGYCFFPTIDGSASTREERIRSYHEGPAFHWPDDKARILDYIRNNQQNDIYWCPSLFEKPQRKLELAMDEHCLWADLDEVDPREIEDYPPTVAWETSPGRYQALWLIQGGLLGASWRGKENHRLTYYLGADPSGWDTTQLLRLPGGLNYKFEYRNGSKAGLQGSVLWANGRRYLADEFEELPELQTVGQVSEIIEGEIDHVDRHEVWGRVRLRVSKRVRDLLGSRVAGGDRSSALWEIERELADAGCSVLEIVSVVRSTVWNKYEGRQDELRRLTIEAAKAVELVGVKAKSGDKGELEPHTIETKPEFTNIEDYLAEVKPPEWLVKEIFSVGTCGVIAGEPKTYKSWIALDLMLSVATGKPFLNHFPVRRPGPVLYIQEEDSGPMLKRRYSIVKADKEVDRMIYEDDGVHWVAGEEAGRAPIEVVVRKGVILSDPAWQSWLEEEVAKRPGHMLLVIDTLMSTAGEVDENRSSDMNNKIYKPLRAIAEKHKIAIVIIHHMRKSGKGGDDARAGVRMLGSQAGYAFVEDGLYVSRMRGVLYVQREGKNTMAGSFKISGVMRKGWSPTVIDEMLEVDQSEPASDQPKESRGAADKRRRASTRRKKTRTPGKAEETVRELKQATTTEVAEALGISSSGAFRQLSRAEAQGFVTKRNSRWYPVRND